MSILELESSVTRFEDFIQTHKVGLHSFHPFFEEAIWEMVKNGGKRFRPRLLFCVVDCINKAFIPNSFLPALALEVTHTYSLIHDDLPSMDDAPLRRGHPTLHTKYDQASAILAGDGLNTYSFYLLSIAKLSDRTKVRLIEELSKSSLDMVMGQALDCYFEKQTLNLEQLKAVHLNKTAKLIAISLKMGAIIANAKAELENDLWEFGLDLGVFFQIRDDIIDKTQDSIKAGKTTSNDTQKNSYVNLLGLEGAKEALEDMKSSIKTKMAGFDYGLRENLEWLLDGYFQE